MAEPGRQARVDFPYVGVYPDNAEARLCEGDGQWESHVA